LAESRDPVDGAPYFIAYIKPLLEEAVGATLLYKGGLVVYTTLSWRLQQAAEAAVASGITALEKRIQNRGKALASPQAALVCLDVESGGIRAMVGGRSYSQSPFNRAVNAHRQPGSAFKPLVFALAVEQGATQARLLLDAPVAFEGGLPDRDWQPENFSRTFHGETTLRSALVHSMNIPAVRLIEQLGPSSAAAFARRLGIQSPLSANLSLALGTSEVNLLELTSAYAVFANRGRHVQPFGVLEVTRRDGRTVWRPVPRKTIVMSREAAAIVTDMLTGVIQEGSGRSAQSLGRPVAGKTGTTSGFRDALFVGFSPTVAAGVWVGSDQSATLGKGETGGRAALPIWTAFMEAGLADSPLQTFDLPDQTVFVSIDPQSGKRVSDDSEGGVAALFLKGTEPRAIP
jgi:penicillin-binding protein 1A